MAKEQHRPDISDRAREKIRPYTIGEKGTRGENAILTDEISCAWSGMTTGQYKRFKGLKKENLRDNMTKLESVLNMLAEATATELSKEHQPETLEKGKEIVRRGGRIAGET